MMVFIDSLALGGYRSFGKSIQRFEKFATVNLLIGQNNCGKSNVLRFLNELYPLLPDRSVFKLNEGDTHLPSGATFVVGFARDRLFDEDGRLLDVLPALQNIFREGNFEMYRRQYRNVIDAFQAVSKAQHSERLWFDRDSQRQFDLDLWTRCFEKCSDHDIIHFANQLRDGTGGKRDGAFFRILETLAPTTTRPQIVLIPAIRKIAALEKSTHSYSGDDLIHRLNELQHPTANQQPQRRKFDAINEFLQSVTGNAEAEIEIPHTRDTINLHMDGKILPLESVGTGIHEVIILAAISTIHENSVICMEEPELHINPILQKKLVRYLEHKTTNQYFITTHSAALMDTPNAEVYHIKLQDGECVVERATSDRHRSTVCEDLGYHPSDLLQTNCIIWVEGPSDRIYLNYWLRSVTSQFVEGIHYSIMFYGGRLNAHISGDDIEDLVNDFISLRRLNRRGVIVIDSDADSGGKQINRTKKRLRDEFNVGPGFAWITKGREVENYLPESHIVSAIEEVSSKCEIVNSYGQFANLLKIRRKGKAAERTVSKVKVAEYITRTFSPDLSLLGLKKQIERVTKFIEASNP